MRASSILAACAIALTLVVGVVLRLADPLSSPVVPAEDPYTHMALVREHLRTGTLSPLDPHQTLYPPGLHAFLAAVFVYTGLDLYGIILLGPVVLGAIGILGMALLLWRTAGPVAGFVGALAFAVAPEAIFRTTMMSPTALDLAVLPFFLDALLRVMAGRLGWAGVAAPMALFFALAHPWILAILGLAGLAYLLLALALPWSESAGPLPTLAGLAACVAILGCSLGVAFLVPGFGGVVDVPGSLSLLAFGLGFAALALTPALRSRARRRADAGAGGGPGDAWLRRGPSGAWVKAGASVAIAAALAATVAAALQAGMPPFVDLPRMVGWPILLLAFAAVVALPFLASPIATLGAALFAATFPFVVFNPFHSEFLSHRTAAFLVVALAMLVGVAAAALVRAAVHAAHVATPRPGPASSGAAPRSTPSLLLAVVPTLLVATLLAGAVYAGTPDDYPGGWYRLYTPCELDALREVARQADADPTAIVLVGDWQAKLVLAALTTDAGRVWYAGGVFASERTRGDLVATMHHNGRDLIVVVDRYLRTETPDADPSFTTAPPWQPVGSWCAATGVGQPRVTAFLAPGGAA